MASTTENRYASIYIDGNAANDTLQNLRKSSNLLKNELNQLPRSSEEFAKKADLLKEVDERLASLRNEAKGVGASFNNMKEELTGFGNKGQSIFSNLKSQFSGMAKGLLAGFSVAGAIESGRKIISQNAELSDSFAGVMKTTGLTLVEVESLNRSFSKMNTRTAKSELLELAQVAGKLGISAVQDVEGFVKAADKIGVALGEDLGGTEAAVESLGKLTDIFKIKDEFGIEESLLKVGSAINSLGAAGAAKESNLIDFSTRLAGIAPAANISLPSVLGLAATLDELGQRMETSSTAIGQFLVEMGKDIPKYAGIAKMSVKDFSDLMRTDANQAFIKVLESSKSMEGGIAALAKSMDNLGVNNSGAVQTLGALSDNIDKLREKQELANIEFDDGTSIIQEFDTANSTLGANLEKIWNKINLIWENSNIRNWLTDLTASIASNQSAFEEAYSEYVKVKEEFDNQSQKILSLVNNYDELTRKTNLSKVEQDKLKGIINQLAEAYPIAAAEMDSYGNIISINTSKVKSLIEAEKALLKIKNKDAIDIGINQELAQRRKVEELREQATKGTKVVRIGGYKDGFDQPMKLDNDELKDVRKKLVEEENKLKGLQLNLKNLGHDIVITNTSAEIKEIRSSEAQFDALKERYNNVLTKKKEGIKLTEQEIKYENEYLIAIGKRKPEKQNSVNEDVESGGSNKKSKIGRKSELERETDRNKELYDKLIKEDAAFKIAMDIADESWWKKQLADEDAKYQKQIDNWKEFLERKHLSKEEKAGAESAIDKLNYDKDVALSNLKVKLESEATEKIEELREKLNSKLLTERAKEERAINDYYESLKKKFDGNPEMLAKIEENRTIDLNDAKIREEKRFHEEAKKLREQADLAKLSGNAKEVEETKSKINAELEALRMKYSDELISLEEFLAAEKSIRDRYAAEADQKEVERQEKKQKELRSLAVDIAQSTSDAIFSITSANAEAELQSKLNKLDAAREKELKAANLTESQKKAINDKYDAMARKEKERAFKAQQKADVIQAGINTALAFTRALPNWINAAAVAVAGAAQIAVIAAKPVPQFFHGGYTGDQPKGWVRKPTVFSNSASGGAFSAGENHMAEYIVSSDQLRDPLVADFVAMMESGRRNDIANLMPQTTIVRNPVDNSRLEGLMMQMIKAYNESSDKKVVFVYQEFEEMRDKKVNIEFGANA